MASEPNDSIVVICFSAAMTLLPAADKKRATRATSISMVFCRISASLMAPSAAMTRLLRLMKETAPGPIALRSPSAWTIPEARRDVDRGNQQLSLSRFAERCGLVTSGKLSCGRRNGRIASDIDQGSATTDLHEFPECAPDFSQNWHTNEAAGMQNGQVSSMVRSTVT